MRFLNRGIYYSPDKDGGDSGEGAVSAGTSSSTVSGGNGAAGNQSAQRQEADIEQRLAQAFANLALRQGGQDAAGILLLQENRGYRDQIRQLEQQVRDLQAQTPAEGAVVLTGDEATRWQAYQELGEPDEILREREEYRELGPPGDIRQEREQHQALQRRLTLNEAATAARFKAPVLERLADGLTVELREEQHDGTTVRVPYILSEEGNAVALADYAQQYWADFLPALSPEQSESQGRTFVQQTPAAHTARKDLAQQFLDEQRERERERKNPLMKGQLQ